MYRAVWQFERRTGRALALRPASASQAAPARPVPTARLRSYGAWTRQQLEAAATASVAVLYASAYGNTASLAQAISHGITKAGGEAPAALWAPCCSMDHPRLRPLCPCTLTWDARTAL